MNCPPSRNPAFVVVACLALAGAWGTSAFEVEQAAKEPASVDRVALLREAPDCLDAGGGPRRALCIFETTLGAPGDSGLQPTELEISPTAAVPARFAKMSERAPVRRLQERSAMAPRTPATASTSPR